MNTLAVSRALRFRWINGQCFEFRFPNGKTLITDPWYHCEGPIGRTCPAGFTTDQLEGGDYIFLNHGHGDHTANIQEVYDRFHSTLITHSAVCMEAARTFNIPLTSIYPVDFEGTYYFDGFMLETHHGTHHGQPLNYQEACQFMSPDKFPGSSELNAMGGVFNMNFILTTDQGFRLAFLGGNDDGMLKRMQGKDKPNIVLRNKLASSKEKDGAAEKFAQWFAQTDVQLLVPMHHESWLTDDPEFAENMFKYMNHSMEVLGKAGRVAHMVRGKWYEINLAIAEIE